MIKNEAKDAISDIPYLSCNELHAHLSQPRT